MASREPLVMAALLCGALLLWFSVPALVSLQTVWRSDDAYSHGYFVPLITAFLIFRELREKPATALEPSWSGWFCVAALVLMTVAGHAATMPVVAYLALPALWLAAIWAVAGATYARRLALPLAFLYSAMPVWDMAGEPLRRLTVYIVSIAIHTTGIPAFIEGNFIHIPSGVFEVVGGCGGLRYAIIGATLGALLGLLNHTSRVATLLLTTSALVLALIGNWLRVFILVAVGHYSEMKHYLIVGDHTVFGWVVFMICMAPLLYIDRKLAKAAPTRETFAVSAGTNRAAGSGRAAIALSATVLLALGVWLNHRVQPGTDSVISGLTLGAPEIPGWQRVAEWDDARRPDFVGATAQVAQWYEHGGERVGAYFAHYAYQSQGREVVFRRNRPEGSAVAVVAHEAVDVPMVSGAALRFDELEVTDLSGKRRLVWLQLRAGGSVAEGPVEAKLLQVFGALRGRPDAQALILTAACSDDCGNARASLSRCAAVAAERFYELAERAGVPSDSKGASP